MHTRDTHQTDPTCGYSGYSDPTIPPIPLPGQKRTFPSISKELQDKAIRGDFIHLGDFSPRLSCYSFTDSTALSAQCDNSGIVHFTIPRKSISSFDEWLAAWAWYEKVLVNYNCTLYNELSTYQEVIHNASRKFIWSAVTVYDQKFRASLAENQSFDFGKIDHDLYVSTFTTSAVNPRTPRCFRCQSMDHKVAECPFHAVPAPAQAEKASPANQFRRGYPPSTTPNITPSLPSTTGQWDPGSHVPVSCQHRDSITVATTTSNPLCKAGSQSPRSIPTSQTQPTGFQHRVAVPRG